MQSLFNISNIHCEGPCDLTISSDKLYTVGSDDIIYSLNLTTKQQQRIDLQTDSSSYHCIASTKSQMLVIGGGESVEMFEFPRQEDALPVYKSMGRIMGLGFSQSGRYLGIASEEQNAVVYNWAKREFVKCRPGHSSSVLSVVFSPDEKTLCSTGLDGCVRIYKVDEQGEWAFVSNFTVCSGGVKSNTLTPSYNPDGSVLAVPGKQVLQQIQGTKLELNPRIKHQAEICLCYWHSALVLVTCCVGRVVTVWNFQVSEKLVTVSDLLLHKVVKYNDTFFGIDSKGSLYEFNKPDVLKVKAKPIASQKAQSVAQQQQPSNHSQPQQQQQQSQPPLLHPIKPTKSKADKLITCLPQPPISHSTSSFRNNRFLYFNEIGCIIQRDNNQNKSIQVEFHNPGPTRRNRSLFLNRNLKHFALSLGGEIGYAGDFEFGMLGEDSWELTVGGDGEIMRDLEVSQGIQGIAIGNQWMAVAVQGAIVVVDHGGNQLRRLEFDRKVVAMAAYEDLLVVVFHDGVPMWGCQSLRMAIYQVGEPGYHRLVGTTFVPLKIQSILKCFGFSTQGMLYSQDTKGAIRTYNFNKSQWTLIHDASTPQPQPSSTRLWLIGLSNYHLLCFLLPQDQLQPTVHPRPALSTLPITLPTLHSSCPLYLNPSTNKQYGHYLWKQITLEHEHTRHELWFKYKASREKSHPLHQLSSTILTQQQLKKQTQQSQMDFLFLIKNMLATEADKAYVTVKTFVRTDRMAAKMAQIFEDAGLRDLAIKIETYFQEKARERQYEAAVKAGLEEVRGELQREVAPRRAFVGRKEVVVGSGGSQQQPVVMPFVQKANISSRASISLSKPIDLERTTKPDISSVDKILPQQPFNPFEKKVSSNLAQKVRIDFQARIEKNAAAAPSKKKQPQPLKQQRKFK